MNKALSTYRNWMIFAVPVLSFLLLITLINATSQQATNGLNLAFSLDLVLTVPLIYFLLIRKSSIPNTTVVPMMIIGLMIGYNFLPKDGQVYLDMFKTFVLPVIEIGVVGYALWSVCKAILQFKRDRGVAPDFYSALKATCHQLYPSRIAGFLVMEIAVVYYTFVPWKKYVPKHNEYTYHKKSGSSAIVGAFMFLVLIETVVVHILLEKWSVVVAWILTLSSIYLILQMTAMFKSVSRRPIKIEDGILKLRYGIMAETEIVMTDIIEVEKSRKSIEKIDHAIKLSPLGDMESHNVILKLNKPHTLDGVYGIKKEYETIALFVDDVDGFVDDLYTYKS